MEYLTDDELIEVAGLCEGPISDYAKAMRGDALRRFARTLLPRLLDELRERRKDSDLLDTLVRIAIRGDVLIYEDEGEWWATPSLTEELPGSSSLRAAIKAAKEVAGE